MGVGPTASEGSKIVVELVVGRASRWVPFTAPRLLVTIDELFGDVWLPFCSPPWIFSLVGFSLAAVRRGLKTRKKQVS